MLSINALRKQNPIVLNVANMVTPQHVADAINFYGGSPIMFTDDREAVELATIASAFVINMGSTNESTMKNILTAGKTANEAHKPVVIDPVAIGATKLRQNNFKRVAETVHFDLIRGNAGEIAYLAEVDWQANGIDAGDGNADLTTIAQTTAKKYHSWVVLSGAKDIVTDGEDIYIVENGHPDFQTNVGSGDMLDGLLGAALAVDHSLATAARCAATFSIAGEIAGEKYPHRPASFFTEVFNQLATISDDEIDQRIKLKHL